MAENSGKRQQRKNNVQPKKSNQQTKYVKKTRQAKETRPEQDIKRPEISVPSTESKGLSQPVKLKAYELYILGAVILLLALIGYTISRSSLPQKNLPTEEMIAETTNFPEAGPQNILGFTELQDQYALCANLLFLAQYEAGNEAESMDILRIANQKYQKLTNLSIEENPAMQPEETDILRKIIHDEENPQAKQALIEDCTAAVAAFEEIYNRQETIDANMENAGD